MPHRAGHSAFDMGLICENIIPGETMIEKNKKLTANENGLLLMKMSEMKINTGNLPLNLIVDDCNSSENENNKDLKRNNPLISKWDKKKVQTMLAKTRAVNHGFNLSEDENGDFNEATMDPNINDLNKKCENLSLNKVSKESECSSTMKSPDLKVIYKEEDLKILSDLLKVLKKHKEELESIDKSEIDADTNEIVLKSRGHIKKNANKNRSTPFDKSYNGRPERPQLGSNPNITVTTNVGNKAHVFVQSNDNYTEGIQEQDNVFPIFYDDVIMEVLNNKHSMELMIEHIESELSKTEAFDGPSNSANIDIQALNIQCGTQQFGFSTHAQLDNNNTLSPPYQSFIPYSPQHSDTKIGPDIRLNTFESKSPQQSFINLSPQHNNINMGHVVSSNPLNRTSPQTFINCSPNPNDGSMAPLNSLNRTSPQLPFNNQTQLHNNVISQPLNDIPAKETFFNHSTHKNNTITKPTVLQNVPTSTSPHNPIIFPLQNSQPSFFINYTQQQETVIQPKVSPVPQQSPYSSPYTPIVISPNMSPCQIEPADSSYETGSPSSSSAVTSPGSPYIRNSISSESSSDQELNSVEPRFVKSMNIVNDQTTPCFIPKTTQPCKPGFNKMEQILKPLGKVIQCSNKSAGQRLDELSKAAACRTHYTVQLVRVAISTKTYPNDCVKGFRENLMKTINTQMDKKHEHIWQLAVFVHLEFMKAPDRVKEYKTALLRKHEKEPSLLFIAAVKRNCPLIARYITEIMSRVGYNPAEVDVNGNNILHVLARLGDSHAEVLGELLAASDVLTKKKIFNVHTKNKEGKSLLHLAASSRQPQITTIVLLINYGADPNLQDKFGRTALQYHLIAMVDRMEGGRCPPVDIELAKKLLSPSSIESQKALDRLSLDPSTPIVLLSFIEDLKCERR